MNQFFVQVSKIPLLNLINKIRIIQSSNKQIIKQNSNIIKKKRKTISMLQNSWSIKLQQLTPHITICCLPNPSFVYQSKSNQLSVYTNNQTQKLPIRKQVLALSTINKQQILILTRYSLNCFDLLNNEERFSLEFENAEKLFVIDNKIYVVSGSSLYCYDANGEELYVNHVSANITAIAKVDKPNISQAEVDDIVIATSDLTMFRYNKLNIVLQYSKIVGKATSLCWVGKGVMVGTQQGPIAYYQSKKSKWKFNSIQSVCKIVKFTQISQYNKNVDFQIKKQDRIVVIRTNGNMQIRDENGATLNKFKTKQNVYDVFVTDFRMEGCNQILCVLQSGTIKAFNIKDQVNNDNQNQRSSQIDSSQIGGLKMQNQIEILNKKKNQLLYNISELKNSLANLKDSQQKNGKSQQIGDILSPDFKIVASLDYQQGLILLITAVSGYIRGLTFQQPIMPIFVQKTQTLTYKFLNSAQIVGDVTCQVLSHSNPNATQFQVRKINIYLPKFWKWGLQPSIRKQIQGNLKFKVVERNSRYLLWMKQCFFMNLSQKQQQRLQGLNQMKFRFYNWYEQKQMQLIFSQTQAMVTIKCDCLKTMGDIFQDLINYIGVKHLNSQLQFPEQKQKIKQLLDTVSKLSQTKVSLSTQLADLINGIKFLLVKGESSRVVGSMNSFRKTYSQIMQHNKNLITEIEKKNQNTKILAQTLKNVNTFINQIANIRYGQPKNQVIAKCRQAIKTKKFPQIFSIMDKGSEYI